MWTLSNGHEPIRWEREVRERVERSRQRDLRHGAVTTLFKREEERHMKRLEWIPSDSLSLSSLSQCHFDDNTKRKETVQLQLCNVKIP